ncbi:Wadjet anti-phage system protein JetD domain-containing protein [Lacisediminihabitans sp.]|jgi:hypothetical protein|uniref:Wadjet anti-phage system protein JetD domain-containing protein n=1 Tax=Lacisediminihabitans sp. TaxID=2787631 RepID=UPI002F941C3A
MKTVATVRTEAAVRFEKNFAGWAQEAEEPAQSWPLSFSLGAPDERLALADFDGASAWARSWLDLTLDGPARVVTAQRSWRSGSQRIPTHLVFDRADAVAAFVRRAGEWIAALGRLGDLRADWGVLQRLDRRTFTQLAGLDRVEWSRIRAFLRWVDSHPTSGLLPRQLPIPGVDSKWFEGRRALCGALRGATIVREGEGEGEGDGFGLRALEPPLTLRVLDERLRSRVGGLTDFSAQPGVLAELDWTPSLVVVCENLQCAYSFGDLPGAVLIAKQGYAVDVLHRLPWLATARILYWGDLDTHGFAILNRFRSYFPEAESLLMDEQTLRGNEPLWATEPSQNTQSLSLLTAPEHAVLDGLRAGVYGKRVRLEQERIPWVDVESAVNAALGRPAIPA